MARHPWLGWITTLALLAGCKVGDPDVNFDDGGFDFDGGFDESGDGDGDDTGDGDGDAADQDGGAVGDGDGDTGDGDGDVGDGDGDAVDPISPQTWTELVADAMCTALEDCLGADLLADAFRGRDCRNLRQSLLDNSDLGYLVSSVDAGRVTFVREQVSTCLSDISNLGCQIEGARMPVSCELAVIGNVELDGDCAINEDCAGDAYCDKGALATCPGYCAPLQSEGSPCNQDDDDQCEDGLICFEGSCERLGALGDDCGADLPACRPGLLCLDDGADLTCESLNTLYYVSDGGACERGVALCESGLVCESTGVGAEGLCRPTVGAGETCRRADPNQCPIDQYCDAENPGEDGTCRDRPGDGEPCVDRSATCADGHRCIDDVCVLLKDNGQGCSVDEECYSGLCGLEVCTGPLMCGEDL